MNNYSSSELNPSHRKNRGLIFEHSILFVLKLERLLGVTYFHLSEHGEIKFDFEIKAASYCLFASLILIGITYWKQYCKSEEIKDDNPISKRALLGYEIILALVPQLLGPLPFLIQMKKLERYLNKWKLFVMKYERLTMTELRLNFAKIRKVAVITFASFIFLPYLHPAIRKSNYIKKITGFSLIIRIERQLFLLTYMLISCLAIKSAFEQYLHHFKKEVNRQLGYSSMIEEYRLLWIRLSKVTRSFGPSIGMTLSICLLTDIMYLIFSWYDFATSAAVYAQKSQFSLILASPMQFILILAHVYFYCEIGYRIEKYSTKDMLNTILLIKTPSGMTALDTAKVNIFLRTLREYRPKVQISGFYVIDRSLFGGILSVLITYMIVIMQIKDYIN